MFSRFFIYRPIFASVISIFTVIIGVLSMVILPIARYPEIAPPSISVSAAYPGADAKTVSDTVAAVIEPQLNGVDNLLYYTTTCSNDGAMSINVVFEVGTNLDDAAVQVQNKVSAVEPRLPAEVTRLGVTVEKKSTDIVVLVALTSPDGTFDEAFLSNYLFSQIKDEVARVDGVGSVFTFTFENALRIWIDPFRLQETGLTLNDVSAALRSQNQQVAVGSVGAPPSDAGQVQTLLARGQLADPEAFAAIVLKRASDGSVVRLRDVARVEVGSQDYRLRSKLNGLPAATMAVYQTPAANQLEVAANVKATMDRLSERFSNDLEYSIPFDNTRVVTSSISEVITTLFITVVLVVLTVFVFLQNFRATIIPTVTIPVSLIGTFAVMNLLGFTINQISLFGLVLVIGIVVDDAIVVVENVIRKIEEKKLSPKQAAEESMQEISGAVIATTLVLLAVFVPTAFLGGITGRLFVQFAVTISVATVLSSINALTLSPALAGVVLKASSNAQPNRFFRFFNTSIQRSEAGYGRMVRFSLRRLILPVAAYGVIVGLAVLGFGRLPSSFVPQEDEGYSLVTLRLPSGASLERTSATMDKLQRQIAQVPGVENVTSIAGYSILDSATATNNGIFFITFTPWDARGDPELSSAAIIKKLNALLYADPTSLGFALQPPSLPGIGVAGGFAMALQDRGGTGLESLQTMADTFVRDGTAQSAIGQVYYTFTSSEPAVALGIDREQVLSKGLTLDAVYSSLAVSFAGLYVNDYLTLGRLNQVKLQADADYRARLDDVLRQQVPGIGGENVALSAVMQPTEASIPLSVTRHNGYEAIVLRGSPAPGFSSGDALSLLESMADNYLPASMGFEWTELSFQETQAGGSSIVIYLFCILFVYLFLAAQYESWLLPMAVVLSVPTALFGAVAALLVRGIDNNLYTQIGIVLLIGLATKTSILLVEFAKELQESRGLSAFDAALESLRLRFRAVLMTAFSFVLGTFPLVIASGAGAAARQVLGTTVFGGMIVATVLSLIFVPVLYYMIQKLAGNTEARPVANVSPEA
ncbi:MAG: efflux RND transporter permease subunit [Opitutales bacterium]